MTTDTEMEGLRAQVQPIAKAIMELTAHPCNEHYAAVLDTAELVVARARAEALKPVRECVDRQAEDEGLWFIAATAPEAYLQQELRKLHAYIEFEHAAAEALVVELEKP